MEGVIIQFPTMRTYGRETQFLYKKTATYQQRQSRCATEWDIRLDITPDVTVLTPEIIINRLKDCIDEWSYALVSGVEKPDGEDKINSFGPDRSNTLSNGNHVHLCLVLHVPKQRAEVLKLVRGPRKLADEYCAPRNPKFAYGGWVIHHAKPGYKLEGEPGIRYENGTLPMDPYTTDWAIKIKSMLKRYGSPMMELRFENYTKLLTKHNIQEQIDKLQMQLAEDRKSVV